MQHQQLLLFCKVEAVLCCNWGGLGCYNGCYNYAIKQMLAMLAMLLMLAAAVFTKHNNIFVHQDFSDSNGVPCQFFCTCVIWQVFDLTAEHSEWITVANNTQSNTVTLSHDIVGWNCIIWIYKNSCKLDTLSLVLKILRCVYQILLPVLLHTLYSHNKLAGACMVGKQWHHTIWASMPAQP